MKKIYTKLQFGLLVVIALFATSCEKEKIDDVMANEKATKINLAVDNMIEVAGGTNYTLDNSELVVPITIGFDGAASKAFTVNVAVATDTVATLIANGAIPAGAVVIGEGTYSVPPVVNIAYGVDSVSFDLHVSRTFMEKNYGKTIALVVKMTEPKKGNGLAPGKNATIVLINTGASINQDKVHYVKFASVSPVLTFPTSATVPGFTLGSQDINFVLPLTLTGDAGALFTVDVAKSNDIVNAAIANGTLTNAVSIDPTLFAVSNPRVTFAQGANTANINLSIRKDPVIFSAGKRIAVGLSLKNPSKWQLGLTSTSLIILIDPVYFKRAPFNGTAFLIKGAVGVASDFIPASNYDFGGEGVAYHDNGGRDGGPFRRPDEVDIADNNETVGWTGSSEWLSYTVNVEEDGLYEMNAIFGSPDNNRTYSVFSGVDIITNGTLIVAQTPGTYGDQQPNRSTVRLKKGIQVLRMFFDNANYDFRGMIFTRANAYDGRYSINGTITRNTDTGPDLVLGGTITNGPARNLGTIGANKLSFVPIWKDGTNVGAIDGTSITIDPATNLVTMASTGNATLHNTPGAVNKYNPATKTLTLNFEWGTAPATRSASLTLVYTGNR